MGKTIQVFGFPYLVTAEVAKTFLEKYTGHGTVYALEVKQSKQGPRAYARVQFSNSGSAELIISLASQRLYFGSSYLKAWETKTDIVQPRAYVHDIDGITLNFGCQISEKKFSVFWKKTDVSIKFGIGLKKIYFRFSCSADYQLLLSYQNIWQIVLYQPRDQNVKILLIQTCSGSDLDGDIYFVCWDPDLIPPRLIQPMDYTPAPSTQLDHDVTIEEVEEYFTNYIVNDSLGIVANAHVVFADGEPAMAMSEPCKQLAQLFSIAVDFPKTGVPAEIPSQLRPKEYPDFMEKPDKTTYVSERVIGKLFRKVKDKTPQARSIRSFTMEVARRSYDADLEVDGFEDHIDEAFDYKTEYDYKLGNLLDYYGIKTEAEILSGGIIKASKTFDRRRDAEAISVAVKSLRKEARSWFKRRSEFDDMLAKASAWYHVTYHPRYWGCYNDD